MNQYYQWPLYQHQPQPYYVIYYDPRITELLELYKQHKYDIDERLRVLSNHWQQVVDLLRKIQQKQEAA